ncbi:MAG: aminoacyl-tRNA hydrolase [Marinilabiliaceae bacterium]|nr:aminoacyl-tRNA hydrolase [Marinilabiliaceae bacterium]
MKYLITGLGNIGSEYANTRHNIGFEIVNAFAKEYSVTFEAARYGAVAECKFNGKILILLKPSTYMNLSGKAVNYWLKKEKISEDNLLIINDDLALPFGRLRLKPNGSPAGHNGLKNIQEILGHNNFARLRFGIGNNFSQGRQMDYVLGPWLDDETAALPERITQAVEIIKSYLTIGTEKTMNLFNNK